MGCDIHMQVELFDWVLTEERRDEVQRWTRVIAEPAAFGERNYALFGLLAGVRAPDMPLLAPARGVPDDAAAEIKGDAQRLGVDGHTHSWVTLKEVLEFDWDQRTPYSDAPTCREACSDFLAWVATLRSGATRMGRRSPENIRLVFWFDN